MAAFFNFNSSLFVVDVGDDIGVWLFRELLSKFLSSLKIKKKILIKKFGS